MVGRGILLRSLDGSFYIINIIITCQTVILNWFQDLTYAKCSAKLKAGKMLNTDDNNGAPELALQHDMAYRLKKHATPADRIAAHIVIAKFLPQQNSQVQLLFFQNPKFLLPLHLKVQFLNVSALLKNPESVRLLTCF